MSILNKLPLELREDIYKHVLIAPLVVAIPPDVDTTDDLLIDRENHGPSWKSKYISYLIEPPRSACISLLLLNRQIHEEVKSVLRCMEGDIDYDIDIVVADQGVLIPTWTRLSMLSRRVRSVKTTFRIAGNGGPPIIAWAFYYLLRRFLVLGPMARSKGDGAANRKDRVVIINHLEMEIVTPPHIFGVHTVSIVREMGNVSQ
ncbi:hypothetical protein EJ08DRAFT_651237 [Tothia fuscella]|uniref:Uncharacterized protein n=1 Tax=Tothia fuscella TaxID=1048955 RepID=A0A9P4TWN4_9PEZI|nr:hypothetical protein EJ08DRAFT_651237 [Tothia fuscella]